MDMTTVFPSRFFSPNDFDSVGKVFTIGNVIMEQVMAEFKPVMYFKGQDKGMVINPTNGKILIGLPGFGKESNNWVGKEVVLFSYHAMFNNQPQLRLGVRVPDGRAATASPAPIKQYGTPPGGLRDEMEDEVPF